MRATIFLVLIVVLLIPAVCAEDALEWYTKGQNAAMAGNHDMAITYFNNALALNPKYPQALAGKAASLNAKKDYVAALSAANQALALRAMDPVALNARALALFGLTDYDGAAEAYDKLFEVQINNVNAYCNQGYALLRMEDYGRSIVAYDRCTKMD
ncbi:tetratricopeptide repeat protein, partial [Methanoregula sp.]|uniref:tetratricopeptide repeat protein n=1 Tax=Methanoregula sp. TaxID=2052170 RepID=UPI000CB1C939